MEVIKMRDGKLGLYLPQGTYSLKRVAKVMMGIDFDITPEKFLERLEKGLPVRLYEKKGKE